MKARDIIKQGVDTATTYPVPSAAAILAVGFSIVTVCKEYAEPIRKSISEFGQSIADVMSLTNYIN